MKKLISSLLLLSLILSATVFTFSNADTTDEELISNFTSSANSLFEKGLITEKQLESIIATATNYSEWDNLQVVNDVYFPGRNGYGFIVITLDLTEGIGKYIVECLDQDDPSSPMTVKIESSGNPIGEIVSLNTGETAKLVIDRFDRVTITNGSAKFYLLG